MQKNTRQRLLDLMIARIGRHMLAARLQIPVLILDDWSSGKTALPDAKLIALINLIDETSDDDGSAFD